MNERVNKLLLAGNKLMPEKHLRQPPALDKSRFTSSACGPFAKNKERTQIFKGIGDLQYIYQNELDKAYF